MGAAQGGFQKIRSPSPQFPFSPRQTEVNEHVIAAIPARREPAASPTRQTLGSLLEELISSLLAPLLVETGVGPWVFLGLCGASYLGSLIAGSVGLGGGILVLATMAVALPPAVLIPVHAVVQLGSNMGRAALLIRHTAFGIVPAFAVGTVIGTAVGANLFVVLPVWSLQFVLAAFVLYATWAPKFQTQTPGRGKFFGVGVVSGFVTLFVGGSAPFVAPFVRSATDERRQFIGTLAMLMILQHGAKIVAVGALGFAFAPYVPMLVGLVGCGFAGTLTGRLLLNRLSERVFGAALKLVLTLLAARLLFAAVGGWRAGG